MRPGQYALLAAAAEDMYQPGVMKPPLPPDIAADWTVMGYVYGRDQLLGFIVPPDNDLYYGFIARNKTSADIVVVIRGTETLREWLIDLDGVAAFIPGGGFVEGGFWSIYETMTVNGVPASQGIISMLAPDDNVVVVGHSLGAALATYLAVDLAKTGQVIVYGQFFASPKPGDAQFAARSAETLKSRYTVYNYNRDLVPHAPPSQFGYRSLPNVLRITPASAQAAVKPDPQCCHSATSYAAMLGEPVTSNCLIPKGA
jgi:triacylglycerol lipase